LCRGARKTSVPCLSQQRRCLADAVTSQRSQLGELAVHGTQLLAETPQFFALSDVFIVNRTKEVREYVLQTLSHEVVSSAMEELLAPDDLVLRLKAEGDGMPNSGRKRSPSLTRWRLVDVVDNPGQVR
jgi:hypothetical protein